jgi:hypothetical protein
MKTMKFGDVKVEFDHIYVKKNTNNGEVKVPIATEARIIGRSIFGLGKEKILGKGTSHCSKGDIFNKEVGRKLALTRAVKQTTLTKDQRTAMWNDYFNRKQND